VDYMSECVGRGRGRGRIVYHCLTSNSTIPVNNKMN
jgi:hypothetical protein